MAGLNTLRVSTRMQLMAGTTLVGLLVLCLFALSQLRDSMIADRKDKTRNLVEVAMGIIAHHHKAGLAAGLPAADAQKAAREALRGLRYGGDDYYFVVDTQHNYVLMPTKPELEGQNRRDVKDAKGKFLFQEIVAAGQAGGGFIDYWFPKPGKEVAEPKLSYAALFTPWGWVVGTGIYIDDVDAQFRHGAIAFGGISLILLVVLSLAGWRIGASVVSQLGGEPADAAAVMREVSAGNLTASAHARRPGSLLADLDAMVLSLREMVAGIDRHAQDLAANSAQIGDASAEVATAAERQADATSSMAAAVQQLTVSSSHIADSARETEGDSREAMSLSEEGSDRAERATQAISRIAETVSGVSARIHALEERASQVSSIANVIKDIAGQTNLLALTAAIEAARAGEQGRGFAVVADEVRKLAERTSLATTEIEQMIGGIQADTVSAVEAMNEALPQVQDGVQLAGSASDSLRRIRQGADRTLARVREVADATTEQSAASTAIAQRIEQIAQMVEETTSTIRGTAEMARQVRATAVELKAQIARFRV